MAYNKELAERVRRLMSDEPRMSEKAMFGGVAFLMNGNMCCGVSKDRLMLRLGAEGAAAALKEPHTAPMDFTGRVIKTMVFVDLAGTREARQLKRWIDRAVAFGRSLPPK